MSRRSVYGPATRLTMTARRSPIVVPAAAAIGCPPFSKSPINDARASPRDGPPMPTQILMPALSPTMEEGKLAKWLVKEGDKIKAGNVIAEIETDKATMEVEAVDEGTLAKILVPEGAERVRVNTPIAVLLTDGESAAMVGATAPRSPEPSPRRGVVVDETTGAATTAPTKGEGLEPPPGMMRAPETQPDRRGSAPPEAAPSRREAPGTRAMDEGQRPGRKFASPLARRLAREAGIDIAAIAGSGPHGRIVKRDIEAALNMGAARGVAPMGTAVATM